MTVDATTGVVIAGPDIVSRGFVYVKEAEDLMEELRNISQMALDRCAAENLRDWNSLKSAIKGDVSDYLFKDKAQPDGAADYYGNLTRESGGRWQPVSTKQKKRPLKAVVFSFAFYSPRGGKARKWRLSADGPL